MSRSPKQEFSSSFDDMLARSREQFDGLLDSGTPSTTASHPPPSTVPRGAEGVARFLDDRYGADGWRWDVAERRRDGDEVTVLVKLTLGASGVSKSQFATGRVSGGGTLGGSVGGVAFSAGKVRGGDETAAYEYATAKALRKCSDML